MQNQTKQHKKIAMLLHGDISNDYRVIKMINSLSKEYLVSLFYISETNNNLFNNERITSYNITYKPSFYRKILRHSFFCYEYNFMIQEIMLKATSFDFFWANDLPTLYPSKKLAKHFKAQLIYDSHEIFNETINQFFPRHANSLKGLLVKSLIGFMRVHGKIVEDSILKSVNGFITVNNSLLNYFQQRVLIKNSVIIMNTPTLRHFEEKNSIDFRKFYSWNIEDRVLLYQGVINEGRGLRILIDVMRNLPMQYKLVIVGDGPLMNELQSLVGKYKLNERVKFVGKVDLDELPNYTKGADIGINLLEDYNLSKKYASPNKLFEYVHADIPVLSTYSIENKLVYEKYKIGLMCRNEVKNIIDKIIELDCTYKVEKETYGKAKIEYSWEQQEKNIDLLFNRLVIQKKDLSI
jgi:glycosyltransferase involved in cell wall biosynthesis